MARKKHHKKKHHTRRRRHSMSGVGGGMTNVLAMVAGAVAGRVLQSKFESKVNPKILAAGQVALGIFLPKIVKNKIAAGIGAGMVVNGGVTALNQFGVISAVNGMVGAPDYSLDYVSGTDNLSILAGGVGVTDQGIMTGDSTDRLSVVAGDMEDMGYSDDESEY
jgi:hypothetical protein